MELPTEAARILSADDDNVLEDESRETKKFTEWAKEPDVRELKQDYNDASIDHTHHTAEVETWLDNLNITGKARRKKVTGRSHIVPKLIRKQAEWRYAALSEPFLSTDDVFNTQPVTFEDRQAAIQNGLVLNNQFNTKIQKNKFIDEYIRTCTDEGTVICRVGWDFQEEIEEVEVPIIEIQPAPQDPQAIQAHQQLHQQMTENPESMAQVPPEMAQAHQITMQTGIPHMPVQTGTETQEISTTIKNCPTVEVCDFRNVVIDPTCLGDLEKAAFIIFSFETSLSELEKDGKYSNLDFINIESNSILGDPDHSGPDDISFQFTDEPRKKFVAYEYWGFYDIHDTGKTEPIVATWVGDTMIRMEETPFPDGKLPFVTVQYLPVRRSIYGQPDGELLKDNQDIIGAVTRGMIDVMGRSANGQQGTRKDALDVTNKRKFDRGLDYEFNAASDPKTAFHMHTFPEIPQSAGLMIQHQNNEAESLTGVKAFSSAQGISGAALGDNATGIRSAMDATSKRELGILRRLATGIIQIGRKIVAMNAVFLDETEIVRITNEKFVEVKRDDLDGDIDITLTISTAEADNDKAQELAFMLQTMGNNMDPGMSQLILADIARLRKMPTLAKQIESYEPPPPDPLEVAKAELEVEKLKAEIAKLESEAAENYAEANLDSAKARESESGADKTDLDFLEQESGVTHGRNLEETSEQSRGNIRHEMVKQNLKNDSDERKERIKASAPKKSQ